MRLKLDFSEGDQTFDVTFTEQSSTFGVDFGEIIEVVRSDADPYTGDYSVTPAVEGRILKTRDKYMREDVTVKPIPYYNVSNAAGGTTAYIAKEI